jgi:rare lipoprotein A (peptidoglycan hydrolase)
MAFIACSRRRWVRVVVPAVLTWLIGLGQAHADPRIDPETGPAMITSAGALIQQEGVASWYGRPWRGRRTANGQRFDERLLTAASLSLPFAVHAHVINLENGRSVDVVVNDRGPYHQGRIIDLSARAAGLLGMTRSGTAQVAISVLLLPSQPTG